VVLPLPLIHLCVLVQDLRSFYHEILIPTEYSVGDTAVAFGKHLVSTPVFGVLLTLIATMQVAVWKQLTCAHRR